jgi:glycosyltransferase involved in cell wall biosynthesis
VLAISELTRRDLVELYGIPEEKIVVTPLAADPAFTPDGPAADGPPYALFVGGLQPRKEPTVAIEALSLLGDDELHLVLAGPDKGGRADTERVAAELGVADRVELRGHVPQDELAALYRGAKCLVFPSRYEGFGLPVLEAMAVGVPVITGLAPATTELGDGAVLTIDGADPVGSIAAALRRLRTEPELADELAARGRRRAAEFSWTRAAERYAALYREVAGA